MALVQKLADTAGVPVRSLMQYTLMTGVAFVMFGVGQTYITNLLGVAYPAFMSFMALKSDGKDDDK